MSSCVADDRVGSLVADFGCNGDVQRSLLHVEREVSRRIRLPQKLVKLVADYLFEGDE